MGSAAERVAARGVETLTVVTDVSDEAAVNALATATLERFGAAHVICNNAGVASKGDPWFGPSSAWRWVLGVNLWGVIHGVRAFLPVLVSQGEGHIVNTASVAGLAPGFGPSYDASKHAVVALSEDLYTSLAGLGLPIGVSVLCPGWVRTRITDADRNWPAALGDRPEPGLSSEVMSPHIERAIAEGATPAAIADQVAEAITAERYWILPQREFLEGVLHRWESIAEGRNPELLTDVPGLPPSEQLAAEVAAVLASAPPPR